MLEGRVPGEPSPAALLGRELDSLIRRTRDWTVARWAATVEPYGTRGDLALHLAQVLAGYAGGMEAAGEERPPRLRAVPRLASDLALPDQLAVVGTDLRVGLSRVEPGAPVWAGRIRATAGDVAVAALLEVVLHRSELDGSAPLPDIASVLPRLPDAEGKTERDVLATARRRCLVLEGS